MLNRVVRPYDINERLSTGEIILKRIDSWECMLLDYHRPFHLSLVYDPLGVEVLANTSLYG